MQINNTNLALLYRGFQVNFAQGLQGAAPTSDPLTLEIPSTHKIEEYDWLGAFPGMRELTGEAVFANLSATGWTITNKKWAMFVNVDEQDIENDNFGLYAPLMSNMGLSAGQHKDELSYGLLMNGFTNLCYTGGAFFSAAQKREAADAGFSNNSTDVLNGYSYQKARANILGRKNAKGRPMGLGKKLILVVGPTLEPVARKILENDTLIETISSGSGATASTSSTATGNINKGTATVHVSPYITGNYWFLIEVGLPIRPLVWQVNKKVALYSQTNAQQSDVVFEKHVFRYQAFGRYNAGYLFPELAYGSTGAGTAPTQYPY